MTVLITGASSGIGKALCKKLAKKGYDLLLVSRREEELKKLQTELQNDYGVKVDHFACDLSNNVRDVYDYCLKNNIKVSILVNNAGFGDYGQFIDSDIDKAMNMIDLNNKALVSLTYYFIQDMKKAGGGHILNVGSVASFMPGPYMAVYYATKSFVLSFSMALRNELKPFNIKVSTLCPGPTKSPFWDRANGNTTSAYNNVFARTVENAASTGMKIIENNKAYEVDGLAFKILIGIQRHLPISLATKIIGFVQAKTKTKKNDA